MTSPEFRNSILSERIFYQQDVLDLQKDLNATLAWSSSNNMKLHPNKFDLLISEQFNENRSLLRHLPFNDNFRKYVLPDDGLLEEKEFEWTWVLLFTPAFPVLSIYQIWLARATRWQAGLLVFSGTGIRQPCLEKRQVYP
eukprot:sb/3474292/